MMNNPRAVLISDVHYSLQTLELADAAMRLAIARANELRVPLIVAGDLHDSKANLRGECVNRMITTFELCQTNCYVLVGNHDKIHEKSDDNALGFLKLINRVHLVATPGVAFELGLVLIPYQHDLAFLQTYLTERAQKKGTKTIIMHQGVTGSDSGEYIQDKTAISTEYLKDLRVISGHYHTRQDIKCGRPQKGAIGLMSYIGSPYTINFAEANDPPKGFQILMDDGTLQFVPTKLRRHIVLNMDKTQITGKVPVEDIRSIDIVKVKYTGTKEELSSLSKDKIAQELGIKDFKLEMIPLNTESQVITTQGLTQDVLLDTIITNTANVSDEQKLRLKSLWRALCT